MPWEVALVPGSHQDVPPRDEREPCLHAQAPLPTPQPPKKLFAASHSHQEWRTDPMDTPGDVTALPRPPRRATRPMALPPTSFPAQSHLSCTLGEPLCSPCPNPALPMGDRAYTHASLGIYIYRDFLKFFFLHTFLVTIPFFYFFFPKQSIHKCH